jgi:hypothetical protein
MSMWTEAPEQSVAALRLRTTECSRKAVLQPHRTGSPLYLPPEPRRTHSRPTRRARRAQSATFSYAHLTWGAKIEPRRVLHSLVETALREARDLTPRLYCCSTAVVKKNDRDRLRLKTAPVSWTSGENHIVHRASCRYITITLKIPPDSDTSLCPIREVSPRLSARSSSSYYT